MTKTIKRSFRSYQGRNFFSRWIRKIFEKPSARQILGLGLSLLVFFLTIVTPQALAFVDEKEIENVVAEETIPIETITEETFRYPLETVSLSQGFSWYHWGIDLMALEGTAVFPVAKGKVIEIGSSYWGFGNYVLIDHENGQKSLYAHLLKIEAEKDKEVTKETVIGKVGHTGWATGDHLHLEIYSEGLPLNPLEVLPER